MDDTTIKSIQSVRDGLKAALDRVCGPEFRQMDTSAVLISEVSVAVHELNSLLCANVVKEPDFDPGNPF